MNPIAQQFGTPYAQTSWGTFGPGWLWVAPAEEGGVTVNTDAGRVVLRAGATSVLAHIDIDTVAARVVLRSGDTSVVTGQVSIDTVAGRVVFRAADTSILASALIDTEAARLVLRAAITSVEGGSVVVIGDIECVVLQPVAVCSVHGAAAMCAIL